MMKKDLFDYFYVPVLFTFNSVPHPITTETAFDLCGHYIPNATCGFSFPRKCDKMVYLKNSEYENTHDYLETLATVAWCVIDLAREIADEVPGVFLVNLRGNDERVKEYLIRKCEEEDAFKIELTEYCNIIKHYSDNSGGLEDDLLPYFGLVLTDEPFEDEAYEFIPENFD